MCHGEPRGEGREAHSCYRGHLPGRCTGLECQWGRPEGRRGSAWRALCRAGEHARCCPAGGICARLSGAHGVSGPRTAPLGPPTGLSSAAPWRSASGGEAPRTALAPPRTAIAVATEVTAVAPGGLPPGPEGQFCAPGATRGGPRAPAPHATCSLCAGAPGGDEGGLTWPSDGLLGGVAAARGAATLTPPARHRAVIRASVWSAEPGLRARGQLQRPCKHGAHGGPEAAVACPGWQKYLQNGCS